MFQFPVQNYMSPVFMNPGFAMELSSTIKGLDSYNMDSYNLDLELPVADPIWPPHSMQIDEYICICILRMFNISFPTKKMSKCVLGLLKYT